MKTMLWHNINFTCKMVGRDQINTRAIFLHKYDYAKSTKILI